MDEDCRFDFIAVYDGPSTTSGLMGQVCGRAGPTFESSSNSLTVVLATDYANSYRGFSASYTSLYAENVHTSKSCSRAMPHSLETVSVETAPESLACGRPPCLPAWDTSQSVGSHALWNIGIR